MVFSFLLFLVKAVLRAIHYYPQPHQKKISSFTGWWDWLPRFRRAPNSACSSQYQFEKDRPNANLGGATVLLTLECRSDNHVHRRRTNEEIVMLKVLQDWDHRLGLGSTFFPQDRGGTFQTTRRKNIQLEMKRNIVQTRGHDRAS